MNESQNQPASSADLKKSQRSEQQQADDPKTLADQDFQPESGAVDTEQPSSRRSLSGAARIEADEEALEEA